MPWPVLLPVHDALRDAYWGAAVVPGLGAVRLAADSVHISGLPAPLLQLQVGGGDCSRGQRAVQGAVAGGL